ncbi:hypothetical protein C8F01DRAFT_1088321 [Mycena amicta]|nr:hypothetical protein C8F01DRAFT_1088321 [Mycena amicta]
MGCRGRTQTTAAQPRQRQRLAHRTADVSSFPIEVQSDDEVGKIESNPRTAQKLWLVDQVSRPEAKPGSRKGQDDDLSKQSVSEGRHRSDGASEKSRGLPWCKEEER